MKKAQNSLVSVLLITGAGTSTHAQVEFDSYALEIVATPVVTPSSGGPVIELWCGFKPDFIVIIEGGDMDVYASEPLFSNMRTVRRSFPPPGSGGYSDGVRSPGGDAVNDIVAGQLVLGGGGGGGEVDDSNPLLLWIATWATRDFTPREVEFAAFPGDEFWVMRVGAGGRSMQLPDPGYATIVVRTDCLADLDGNAQLDVFDFIAFQNFFMDASPVADLDADGDLTIFDFLTFQNAFEAGC
ncbi:MAG: GC-type dockerin domain-anchored protein [Phycisphaerales bacterium JB060]